MTDDNAIRLRYEAEAMSNPDRMCSCWGCLLDRPQTPDDLGLIVATPPPLPRALYEYGRYQCYANAAVYISTVLASRPGVQAVLVHAVTRRRCWHAFVELPEAGLVYDPTWREYLDLNSFRAAVVVVDERRYEGPRALAKILKEGRPGPWDEAVVHPYVRAKRRHLSASQSGENASAG